MPAPYHVPKGDRIAATLDKEALLTQIEQQVEKVAATLGITQRELLEQTKDRIRARRAKR